MATIGIAKDIIYPKIDASHVYYDNASSSITNNISCAIDELYENNDRIKLNTVKERKRGNWKRALRKYQSRGW